MTSQNVRIDRVRLGRAGPDGRARVTGALGTLTLSALGLPPRSTLIVRKLSIATPLPCSGSLERFSAAVRDDLRARAVLARRGRTVADDADLLFEDDAALEAAIVVDCIDRPAPTSRAWWIPVVGATPPPERWRRAVFQDTALLPRILVRLVESGHVARWLARFEPCELARVTQRLIDGFGVVLPVRDEPAAREHTTMLPRQNSAAEPTPLPNPVRTVAPEAADIATIEARILVTVALAIVRRPAIVATPAFVKSLTTMAGAPPQAVVTAPRGPGQRPQPPRVLPKPMPVAILRPQLHARPARSGVAVSGSATLPQRAASAAKPVPETARTSAPPHNGEIVNNATAPVAATDAATMSAPVETGFGGLFFLLNAFVALGLYGDATRPADGLKGLSPFELLVLLGDRWFGAAFRADPLRATLVRLSGLNPRDRPGRDFAAPVWTIPDNWLRPWPLAEPIRRGKVRWHPAGFVLTDDATTSRNPAWQRRRWVACLTRYLEARLRQVLDDDDSVAMTCTASARLTVDGDRVEARFALDRHPIALRLAGLDRDPGWMPMAGHSIGFVFA